MNEVFIDLYLLIINHTTLFPKTRLSILSYLSTPKDTLSEDECIILLYFAENYYFLVQYYIQDDAAQGFHWNNSQATIHPFVTYFRNETEKFEVKSV